MAKEPLVTEDVEDGFRYAKLLAKHGFPVTAAVWVHDPDAERWRLLIAKPKDEQETLYQSYRRSGYIFSHYGAEIADFDTSKVDIVFDDDQRILALCDVRPPLTRNYKRVGGTMYGNVYID
jgi:hypothetical protein